MPHRDSPAPSPHDADWWRQAVVYQIYPRSFADFDGDGIGDIPGVTSRLPYLADLGVDAVWLSPFYPSQLADGGYDVADYRDVDPRLGTLDDFDEMVGAARRLGLKIMVDIVPNHSSDQHVWFQKALAAAPGSAARERYVFRDGRGEDGELPPTDWPSSFGGPAWTRAPDGQWYLHLYAPQQPDFNWDNPEVREDFHDTLRFWSDRGVAGFRVDVAHGLAKDLRAPLRDLGEQRNYQPDELPDDGSHPLWDRDAVHEIYRGWRQVFDAYDPPRFAVAEAWVRASRRTAYASADGLGQAFNFDFLGARLDAAELHTIIDSALADARAAGATSTWVLSNHDVVRHVSRYALPGDCTKRDIEAWLLTDGREPAPDLPTGVRKARAAALLMLALPGSAYLYQGEELGLPEVADLDRADLRDPMWVRSGGRVKGRDGCRVPLPWTRGGTSFGFGPGGSWLPQPAGWGRYAADAQRGDKQSFLELYREALRLRRTLVADERLEWVGSRERTRQGLLHFARAGGWHTVGNLSGEPVPLPRGEVLLASGPLTGGELPPWTTAWLRTGAASDR
ncbi:glycoside hydrolase family 13 protein [Streptomyces iranensis]|uniref:Alpha-glucosidase n=1 Tax=Streptomyces iranensis TaxID=576784 RepID=A0A061ACT4_9ACTN|nr:glycoside hydrolase family 13 protein [Streptomyces iranensis]MBP2063742.1 alpha-glucosidase [Streptomyces iranensis]CDR17657.1 alpha-glucosidase [Streptomyces iranensis]